MAEIIFLLLDVERGTSGSGGKARGENWGDPQSGDGVGTKSGERKLVEIVSLLDQLRT